MSERPIRTSETDPIRVDCLPSEVLGLPGRLGMTFAPGKKASGIDGYWERDLDTDLLALREVHGANTLVSLMEEHEYRDFGIPELFEKDRIGGIDVLRFPIRDVSVPREAEAEEYQVLITAIIEHLKRGENVVVHCRGGLGRTGTVAACVLVALGGHSADEAIESVRRAREYAVESGEQEDFVRRFEETLRSREGEKP
ncbi:MAG: cyclin-dependent kinase inhibitor 3 family protein [Actinomycetota bacterium]|nr:cyclin-dependent kinase inhibitor 3 family protein [Actinomycetota bacterium]